MSQEDLTSPAAGEARGGPVAELRPAAAEVPLRRRPAGNPFLTRGTVVLVGVYAAGIAGLYGLKLRNGPSTALADQGMLHAKVEAALNVMGAAPPAADLEQRRSAKAIVGEFYTAARQRQTEPKDLKGNPFLCRIPEAAPVQPTTRPEPAKPRGPDEADQALAAAKTLKLQSVLVGGREPTAMISQNLLTEGQTIKGWTVSRITPTEVELTWRDRKHVLEMPK